MTPPTDPPRRRATDWPQLLKLVRLTLRHWREDNCPLIAAGLAYYTTISLVPLFILALALSGRLLGPIASMNRLAPVLESVVGAQIAVPIERMVEEASRHGWGGATLISIVVLFWVASNVFAHLQRALNILWETQGRGGVRGALRTRLWAVGMVMGVGMLVLIFAAVNAGFGLLRSFLDPLAPFLEAFPFWWTMNLGLFFVLMMLFWGMVYRFLPALKLRWRDVGMGALVTSVLMTLGISGLSYYFTRIRLWSVFGAATSVMVVLIWVYFSNQIFLLGAEFTWAWAHRRQLLGDPAPFEAP